MFERIRNTLRNYLRIENKVQQEATIPRETTNIASTTKSSEQYWEIFGIEESQIPSDYRGLFELLEWLSVEHQDFSFAITNILDLGNTDFEFRFPSSVPKRYKKQMIEALSLFRDNCYRTNGSVSLGYKPLVRMLLRQLSVHGALSVEGVYDLKGNGNVVQVPHDSVYLYNIKGEPTPYQQQTKGMTALNPNTYKYIPLDTKVKSPYGIPPFVSALEAIGIEQDMIKNFAQIVKKLGLFGFLQVVVTPPQKKPGEDEEAYIKRAQKKLQEAADEAKKTKNDGIVAGFKGMHEFTLEAANINSAGAEAMLRMIDILKISGMKQNANMLNRQMSTTETFGRVLLAILGKQVISFQEQVAVFLESYFKMHLRFKGFDPKYYNSLQVWFELPLTGDKVKEEEISLKKAERLVYLRNEGIISQDDVAIGLGFEKAFADAPVSHNEPAQSEPLPPDGAKTDPNNPDAALSKAIFYLTRGKAEYLYEAPETCGHAEHLELAGERKYNNFVSNFADDIASQYKREIKAVTKSLGAFLKKFDGLEQEEFTKRFLTRLYGVWDLESRIEEDVKSNVNDIYKFYRKDKAVFKLNIPDPVIDGFDKRVMEWFRKHSSLYLGKFITDEDTKQRIAAWIAQYYVEQGGEIGEAAVEAFTQQFPTVLAGEEWKIKRITDTVANQLRNGGKVAYMQQADVEEYEIVEVMDKITCPHCKEMNARKFKVATAVSLLEQIIEGEEDAIISAKPFATTIKPKDIADMTSEELASKGILSPPFHPSCRGVVVAVL
jgi:hypothetical protein